MQYHFQPFFHNTAADHLPADSDRLDIPELSDGFDPSLLSLADGIEGSMIPHSFITERVPCGLYAVHITLTAVQDVEQLFLFTGRKLLRDIISLKKGDRYERTFYQSIAGIIPRYHEAYYPVENLFVTLCTPEPGAVRIEACYAEAVEAVDAAGMVEAVDAAGVVEAADAANVSDGVTTVYLCGDSTVTDQSAEIPYLPGACYASWGQALPAFLDGRIAVENQAHCGLTTETFRQEGHMDIVKHFLRPGDFCLIQFGHNDQKLPHLRADREYPVNLRRYIEEVRNLRGIPVLVTSPGRNIWKEDGTYHELLAEHVQAVKDVAVSTNTTVIDLHEFSVRFYETTGMERSCGYFHPGDYTHTNEYGACLSASCIAAGLGRIFPEVFHVTAGPSDFTPPENLWDLLDSQNNRAGGTEQKEQFDAMEKSTAALLKVLEEADQAPSDE